MYNVSGYSFLDPSTSFPLPGEFDYDEYIDTERELWALFPETDGKRVNFFQAGLTARVYVETDEDGELRADETYFLMPCADRTLKPVRMRAVRPLTLREYRLTQLTALKLAGKLDKIGPIFEEVHMKIMGPEIYGAD